MKKNITEISCLSELYQDKTEQSDQVVSISAATLIPLMVHSETSQTRRKRRHSSDVGHILTATNFFSTPIRETNQLEESNITLKIGSEEANINQSESIINLIGIKEPNINQSESNRNLIGSEGSNRNLIKSNKESRVLNRKELRNLRMQIAMISDADGDRPIHVAVVQENLKLVQKLCAIMLKAAISIDLTNYLRQTPLHLAVMLGNVEMVKLLLKCGSSLTLKDRNGNSVIHLAVKTDAKNEVLCLLLSHPLAHSILNSMDHEGYTALHYAVLKGNKLAVTCLDRCHADMNVTDGKSGRTALMFAIMERNSDMVKHLLDSGALIDVTDYSGRSAFELAMQVSDKETLKILENRMVIEEPTTAKFSPQNSSDRNDEGNPICQKFKDENNENDSAHHRTKKFKSI